MLYFIVGLIIPIIFKFSIFENPTYSLLSNDGWASFLGSYAGGALGGLGTLIAMYFTVRQTTEIQEQNKKDTDKRIFQENLNRNREYNQDKTDRMIERMADEEARKKELRLEFADSIAELIGKYITQISNYHYASLHTETLNALQDQLHKKYVNCELEYKDVCSKLEKIDNNAENCGDKLQLKSQQERLKVECDKLERSYYGAKRECENNRQFGNRLEANEAFFTIKAKLSGISVAEDMIHHLEEIHRNAGTWHDEPSFGVWISSSTDNLIKLYESFRENFVAEG